MSFNLKNVNFKHKNKAVAILGIIAAISTGLFFLLTGEAPHAPEDAIDTIPVTTEYIGDLRGEEDVVEEVAD